MEAILAELFGAGWANLLQFAPDDGSRGNMFGVLFGIFNAAVAVFSVVLLFFVSASAIADTGHQGQVMGKTNALYAPIRFGFAAFMMLPVVKGFSILQVFILNILVAGSLTIAGAMGTELTKFIAKEGGTFTSPIAMRVDGVSEAMLYSAVCASYYNDIEYAEDGLNLLGSVEPISTTTIKNKYNPLSTNRWFGKMSLKGPSLSGQGEMCGSYHVECQDTAPNSVVMCQKQLSALEKLYWDVQPIARAIVNEEDLSVFSGGLARANGAFSSAIESSVRTRLDRLENGTDQVDTRRENAMVDLVQNEGFVALGKWYLVLTQISEESTKYANKIITYTNIDQTKAINPETTIIPFLNRASSFVGKKSVGYEQSLSQVSNLNEEMRHNYEKDLAKAGETDRGWFNGATRNDDPLALFGTVESQSVFGYRDKPIEGIQRLGNFLTTSISALWVGGAVVGTVVKSGPTGKVGKLFDFLKMSKDKTGSNSKVDFDASSMASMISYLLLILFLVGLVLLYYVPSIPFILWTIGVVGYLIILIESLAAAALWAASFFMPSGDGFASDASRQGFHLLVNLVVRPPLMVFGLFAGGGLMIVAVKFAVDGYHVYAVSLMNNRHDLFGFITYACLVVIEVALVVGIIHKTHSLITELSDRVVEWVTTKGRPTNDDQTERNVSAAVVGHAAHRTGEGAGGAANRGGGGGGGEETPLQRGNRSPSPSQNQDF